MNLLMFAIGVFLGVSAFVFLTVLAFHVGLMVHHVIKSNRREWDE